MAGMWNFDGRPVDREFLGRLGDSIDQYGPDGGGEYLYNLAGSPHAACWAGNNDAAKQGNQLAIEVRGSFAMIYRAFHTNRESRLERLPYVSKRGNVMTWDGRLDNREELTRALSYELSTEHSRTLIGSATGHTDVAIVMGAWEAWGTDCFKRLIGDYSLAVWEPSSRTLTMAKDFIGVRYLYYEILPEGIRSGGRSNGELGDAQPPSGPSVWWCSRLEPLILLSGRQYDLNEEYIAGYFAFHPANHITPYMGVDALPAGHYVQIRNGQKKLVQYWHFDPDKRIRYKTDAEYEEQFRQVFFQSVKRRLRADAPVVAGLSGGRDSSAIVCVADEIIARGEAETPRLDTYSRYDEEEPFGNDKPYLTIVEQKRGRAGHHFGHDKADSAPSSTRRSFTPTGVEEPFATTHNRLRPLDLDYFSAHPGIDQWGAEAVRKRLEFMKLNGYRIILSGVGGDEVTGGVPYCISELADLLVQGRFVRLTKQLKAWGLTQKRAWPDLAWNTFKSLEPDSLRRMFWNGKEVWAWIDKEFVEHQRKTFIQLTSTRAPRKGLPSFRTNIAVAVGVSWQLAHVAKLHRRGARENPYDRGFPFLDRDFLEFMFAIPREQVLRPGQYRSLMRRALAGIVPNEILNRTRKAFSARRSALGFQFMLLEIRKLFSQPPGARLGWVNGIDFLARLDELSVGKNDFVVPVRKTLTLEMWLRSLAERRMLNVASAPLKAKERVLEGVA